MNNNHDLGLTRTPEIEKKEVFSYLNKTTSRYKDILSDLIDAAYNIQLTNKFPNDYLVLFEKAVREPYLVVFCHYSGKFLSKLSYTYVEVEQLLIDLSSDKKSGVRFNNITNMVYVPSKKALDIVIENGLKDKSSRVRAKTADVIGRIDNINYANSLLEQIELEKNEKVKEEMKFSHYWLLNDYKVRKTEFGYDLTVKTDTGFVGKTINKMQFDNLKNVVKKIKENPYTEI